MHRHLELGDYFHNLAWKLGVLEEDLRDSLARHEPPSVDVINLIELMEKDLLYLQDNYQIERK